MNKFFKISIISLLLFVCFSTAYAMDKPNFEIPTAFQLREMTIEKESDNHDFLQALNCYYNFTDQSSNMNLQSDKDYKKCIRQAKDLMENFTEKNKQPIYLAFAGFINSINLQYDHFPFVIFSSKKAIKLLNKAVIRDMENPEIRFYRLSSLVNYPKKYYDFEETILEDYEMTNAWFDELLQNRQNTNAYLNALYSQALINFFVGKFYHQEIKNDEKALLYFSRIPNDLPSKPDFYLEMEEIKKEIEEK